MTRDPKQRRDDTRTFADALAALARIQRSYADCAIPGLAVRPTELDEAEDALLDVLLLCRRLHREICPDPARWKQ